MHFFFFFLFLCCCYAQPNVWHLNHSFTFNSLHANSFYNGSYSYNGFPTVPGFVFSPLDLNISYVSPGSVMGYVHAFLCFISPSPLLLSHTLSICMATFLDGEALNFTYPMIVWSANRGNPVQGEIISLTLDNEGNLLLRGDNPAHVYWATNTANMGVVRMEFSQEYPVNLILFDSKNKTIWQSVDYPSDTLTFNQSLKQGMKLVSWASSSDPSEGNFSLVLEHSGVAFYSNIPTPQPYWIKGICGQTLQSIKNSSCYNLTELSFSTYGLETSVGVIDFAYGSYPYTNTSLLRLEWDGNVRAYAIPNGNPMWEKVYDMFSGSTSCSLPMRCGPYGVCKGAGQCACPGGNSPFFVQLNASTQTCGLAQSLQINCPLPNNNTTATHWSPNLQMLEVQALDYLSNVYTSPLLSIRTKQRCKDECLLNCSCLAAFWHNQSRACFHVDQMGALQGNHVNQFGQIGGPLNNNYHAFFKVEGGQNNQEGGWSNRNRKRNYVIGVVCGLASLLLLFSLLYFIYRRVRNNFQREEEEEEEAILDAIPGLPTRYSYKDLHSATNGFAEKLGQGGFGSVYAGTLLLNGIATKVAVKQLEGVRQGDKEFRSEVAIMGAVHHFNLLHLLGFCAQGSHRLLVYEYMENGSLDQCLFVRQHHTMKTPLPWDVRFRIGLGAARGLAYLHEECRERILHLDIKPQNILLDENYVPKVADFGLSRLMERDKSHVMTTMRGTPGYLAPEWVKEGAIDEKCDVFSFGMLLLEIISGRKNLDHTMESQEQIYYPEWAFWQAQKGKEVSDLTDAKIESDEEEIEVRRMINTAFLCLLEKPTLRPSMEKVVQMLEGRVLVTHINLSTLHQGLLFVLRNPSNVSQTHIEKEIDNILASSPTTGTPSYSAEVSSFYISTR